ncbi:MAG: PEP-CTERM sorting domain-containing protein [Bryobacteraceae bacterium]
MMKTRQLLTVLCGGFLALPAAGAVFTAIPSPDASYLASTTYIDFSPLSDFADVSSVTDGLLTLTFSSSGSKLTVPGSWGTWSVAPDSQRQPGDTLPLLFFADTSVSIALSQGVAIFGFEAEPDPFNTFAMTANFYDATSTLLGSISRSVDGYSGARLFAAASSPIWRVDFSCDGCDFAIGAFRYGLEGGTETPIPEPASSALLGVGLGSVVLLRHVRRTF